MVRQKAEKEEEYINRLRRMKDYTQLIENNSVFAEYIRTHEPSVEEITEFYKESQNFCLRVLTDKKFRDKFMEEIYHYLRDL